MQIVPPRNFRHAAEIPARFANNDPRAESFSEDSIEIDLRECEFVRPPAVLWCVVYPLLTKTRGAIRTQGEVDELANKALDSLSSGTLGAASLYPLVSEVFAELALNAVEHSESPIGAFGFIHFYEFRGGSRFVCGVADGGIGIRRSLERNPQLAGKFFYDWDAN